MKKLQYLKPSRKQGNYEPKLVLKVCKWNYPQVVFSDHLRDSSENVGGTFVWISCPKLKREVSYLEARIKDKDTMNEFLPEARQNFEEWLRKSEILTKDEFVKWKLLKRYGNEGTKEVENIKCLHSHLAMHMIGVEDKIGQETSKRVQKMSHVEDENNPLDCPKSCIECKKI